MQISNFMMSPALHRRAAGGLPVAAMQNRTENLVQSSVSAPAANPAGSKKANPLQENISRLQARIEEVKGNDEMRPEAKDALLKTMMQQLADLQKQMAEAMRADKKSEDENDAPGSVRDRFGTANVQDKKSGKKSQEDARLADLLSAGASLQQSKESGAFAAKAQSVAQRMERELDYATNHPIEALRLTNPEAIQNRQKEIASLQLGINQMRATQAYGAQAAVAPTDDAAQPGKITEPASPAAVYEPSANAKNHAAASEGASLPAAPPASEADAGTVPAAKDAEGDREVTMCSDKNVDDEIQKLKAKKQQIQAQLAKATSPDEKAAIQQQLRQLDAQIQSKDSAAYRQSHAHYWQA
ncbi:hypothetical protein QCO44_04440 [Selenomonas sputigena]|uniref:Uncharacterized protein n=1 Tax=Selenomonas sputigena TaxID=69823 RepID=A0ABV3X402_9FIRM